MKFLTKMAEFIFFLYLDPFAVMIELIKVI